MKLGRITLVAGAMALAPHAAVAQEAAAEAELPAVDVVQETPVQKAARAKKKAPAVSPLSSAPTTVATEGAGGGGGAQGAGGGLPAPPTVPSAVTNVTDADIEAFFTVLGGGTC